MKYWYDTEFIDDGRTIDLVSIGIVAEDGRKYYAVSNQFNMEAFAANPFLVEHVAPSLPLINCPPDCQCDYGLQLDQENAAVRSRHMIARDVGDFLGVGLTGDEKADLWGWYPAYDHVVLAQLFGSMADLPKWIPWRTNDIEQEYERFECVGLQPEPGPGVHNALQDALYHRRLWEALETLKFRGVISDA